MQETWLGKDSLNIGGIVPEGYEIANKPRESGRGGGVAIIYRQNIQLKRVASTNMFSSFEHIEVVVKVKSDHIRIVSIYRPPPTKANKHTNRQFFEEFSTYCDHLASTSGRLVLVGDLNFHLDNSSNKAGQKFNGILNAFGLEQHINVPTHKHGHTLDVAISRSNDLVIKSWNVHEPGLCNEQSGQAGDHLALCCILDASKPPPIWKTVTYRKLRSINVIDFKKDLSVELARNNFLECDEIDGIINIYNNSLKRVIDSHAPEIKKALILRPFAPWYTEELRNAKQKRRKLERRYRRTKLEVHKQIFRHQCCVVNKMVLRAKKDYFSKKVLECGHDQKALFGITNKLLNKTKKEILPDSGSAEELAERFLAFFTNKIKAIQDELVHSPSPPTSKMNCDFTTNDVPFPLQSFSPITDEDILKIIKQSTSKTCQLDPCPTWLIKDCIDTILPLITRIVNVSMSTATVPSTLKLATIKPHLKKPSLDPEILKNYRPVSNLTFLSKVIEKVVAANLKDHLKTNGLYEKMQSAYREAHSTETTLTRVQNDLLKIVDAGGTAILLLLDLSAAFDTLEHAIILDRLDHNFGIRDSALDWFRSYLSNRKQSVQIDGKLSNECTLDQGVPQGSVLGPILFTMYTTPLGKIIRDHNLDYHLYADDTQLYIAATPEELRTDNTSRIEDCVCDIRAWMHGNMLKLNDGKTELIVFNTKRKNVIDKISVQIGDHTIIPSKQVRNLGVIFDNHITMEAHVNNILRSSYINIQNIGRIRKYLTEDAAKSLIHAYIMSKIDYGNTLLYGVTHRVIHK
ncbi:MAG: hypothetical protein KAG61_03570, partial [Bacteriovoracaceae bacterium]|nr:hypothetical protein [Bacteriovoracaceae bacterium]